MDFIGGLATIGTYMNYHNVPPHIVENKPKIKRTPINGNNIYDNAKYREYKLYVDNIADERYTLAKDPMKTGVIPNFYNQLQEVQRRDSIRYRDYLIEKENHKKYLADKEKAANDIVEGFDGIPTKMSMLIKILDMHKGKLVILLVLLILLMLLL